MPLKIRDRFIYTSEGVFLKEISCPKNIGENKLTRSNGHQLHCKSCNKDVLNTDTISEAEITYALMKNPTLCLYINLYNPTFEIDDGDEGTSNG